MQIVLDILELTEDDKSRVVLNAINKSSTKHELRELITGEIVNLIIKTNDPAKIFVQIKDIEFKNYPIKRRLADKIRKEIIRLNKRFVKRPPTKKVFQKNLVGLSLLNSLEIEGNGKLNDVEQAAIKFKLEQLIEDVL